MEQQLPDPIETKVITDFSGRLTRKINGDLNSGLAKFTNSVGYDPFSKPGNLTWFENTTDITGPISDLVLAGKVRWLGETDPAVYAIGSSGKLYKVQVSSSSNPAVNSVIAIASVKSGGATYVKGASIDFFGSTERIYVGADSQVNKINFDGSADAVVGSLSFYAANVFRPLKQFTGKLLFGNGPTIGAVDATGTINSSVIGVSSAIGNIYSELNPAFGVEARVRDIDVSPDNNYAMITAANMDYENISTASSPNRTNSIPAESAIYRWNGTDAATTAASTLPANVVSALQTYLQNNLFFTADSFGGTLSDVTGKMLTLPGNKSPFPNATGVNGNFIFWICPENLPFNTSDATPTIFLSMYYYGSLDQENPPGLYRMFRLTPDLFRGNYVQSPLNMMASTKYADVNTAQSSVITVSNGTHYFSTYQVANNSFAGNASILALRSFNVPATGTGTPQSGVYETQTQLFSKKISVKQIRVYTEPTATSNGFTLNCIGSDGTTITNGTFSYTYAAGTDETKLQGSLERIDFNPAMKSTFALGIQVINSGSVNMTIKKIEIDYTSGGK